MRALLDLGSDVHARTTGDWMPLHCASHSGSVEAIRVLLVPWATVDVEDVWAGMPELHMAGVSGSDAAVLALLDAGADVNHKDSVGQTLLHVVCTYRSVATVRALLAQDVDVDAATICGLTALHMACRRGSAEMVQKLLDAGVDAAKKIPWPLGQGALKV